MIDFDRRYVLIPVLIGIAFVAISLIVTEFGRAELMQSVRDIQQSQKRESLLVEVQSLVTDAETGERGYELTGDETYLQPYEMARREISGYMTEVESAYGTREQAAMHPLAARLIELCSAKLTELDSTIALYQQGPRQAMALVRTKIGQEKMDSLRGLIAQMRDRERQVVEEQTNAWLHANRTHAILSAIGSALNIVLIVLAGYLVTKDIRRRTGIATELESQVRQQTRELSELSTHLQRASETEKFALARELHDELGGLLVAIKMDLAQLRSKFDLSQPDVQKRWERIQGALSSGIDMKRRIIEQLRPSLLDNMGLTAAIRWQAGEICSAAGLKLIEHYPEPEPAMNSEAAIAIFRIAQEALTNIVKHARATQVTIELTMDDGEFVLTIQDNGVGFFSEAATVGS